MRPQPSSKSAQSYPAQLTGEGVQHSFDAVQICPAPQLLQNTGSPQLFTRGPHTTDAQVTANGSGVQVQVPPEHVSRGAVPHEPQSTG
jgi:hypothetical protein